MAVVRSVLYLAVLLFTFSSSAQLSIVTTSGAPADVRLGWNPSPSPNAAGYFLCWGLVSGQCTNRLNVANVTNTSIVGLQVNVPYYFTVVAYSDYGDEAPPSNEVNVRLAPPPPAAPPGQPLEMVMRNSDGQTPEVQLGFNAVSGRRYEVQATSDFRIWYTVFSTNSPIDTAVTFREPRLTRLGGRFYRLCEKEQTAPPPPRADPEQY